MHPRVSPQLYTPASAVPIFGGAEEFLRFQIVVQSVGGLEVLGFAPLWGAVINQAVSGSQRHKPQVTGETKILGNKYPRVWNLQDGC